MSGNVINKHNPLARFMRQPKIYIQLPSGGKYWPTNAIDYPENGELAVYSMTARDEILLNTPDALLNGQAIVDVIHSCVPAIKNAWETPSIDIELLLVAIQVATHGSLKSIKCKVPVTNEEVDYEISLHHVIDHYSSIVWREQVVIDQSMIVFLRPLSFRHMNNISRKGFEANKRLSMVDGNNELSDSVKSDLIRQSFKDLTDLTTDTLINSIAKINVDGTDVSSPTHIREFIENSDKSVADAIQSHLNDLKQEQAIKPIVIQTTEEQRAAGAPETFEVPLNFNQSDFFG